MERLAAAAVRIAHEAADMLAVAASLPIPEWSVELYALELQSEMDAVLFEWPDMPDAQLKHFRQIATNAFERRLALLTFNAPLGGLA
jgi:hypothetical protein